jgi:TRAP transporter TAXI family solute receptor
MRLRRLGVLGLFLLFMNASSGWAQNPRHLSIATGSAAGVYYPLAKRMAEVLSRDMVQVEVTAKVTSGSVENIQLMGDKKADLGFVPAEVGWGAYQGKGRFKQKIPLRTVVVLYPNTLHIVTRGSTEIEKVADLRGKRISTGTPGSGTETKSLRILESYGVDPDKDTERSKLGAVESAGALREGKIDAYFWDGGLPAPSVVDLASSPGLKIRLIPHGEAVPKMRQKYGPFYVSGIIPANTYPGQKGDVPVAVVWNLLVCSQEMNDELIFGIVKTFFDHRPELVPLPGLTNLLTLESQREGSPIPFHPGAIRYFREKGLEVR